MCHVGSRWWTGKFELTSSYWHTKTLHREQRSLRTKGRPVERMIDTNMGGASRDPVWPGHMPWQQPAGRRDITRAEALSKEQGIWAPHQAPKPGEPAQGRWAPHSVCFENQQGLCQGEPEGISLVSLPVPGQRQQFEKQLGYASRGAAHVPEGPVGMITRDRRAGGHHVLVIPPSIWLCPVLTLLSTVLAPLALPNWLALDGTTS